MSKLFSKVSYIPFSCRFVCCHNFGVRSESMNGGVGGVEFNEKEKQ